MCVCNVVVMYKNALYNFCNIMPNESVALDTNVHV